MGEKKHGVAPQNKRGAHSRPAGDEWVTCHPWFRAWELTGPDVAFRTRGVFSPLLLGLRIPIALDTRVMRRTCFATPIHRPFPLLCSPISALSSAAVNDLSLCGFRNSYDFIHARSPFVILGYCSSKSTADVHGAVLFLGVLSPLSKQFLK